MRYIRESRGFTLQAVAYAMGCSTAELQAMEDGAIEEGSTWIAKLVKWSEGVGMSLSLLLEGEWTHANQQVLFLQQRDDAKDKALAALATLNPQPTITEARGVLSLID